jgi:hypothetical protein
VTFNSLVICLFVAYRERVARPFGRGGDGWVVCVCDLCVFGFGFGAFEKPFETRLAYAN